MDPKTKEERQEMLEALVKEKDKETTYVTLDDLYADIGTKYKKYFETDDGKQCTK